MAISFGTIHSQELTSIVESFTSILWGPPGCGKTTLASTAHKPILFLQFDPSGTASVQRSDGIEVLDFSTQPDKITDSFKSADNRDMKALEKGIVEGGIRTVVLDSITSFGNMAFGYAIGIGPAYAKGRENVTLETPGFTGYGIKNMLVSQAVRNLLTVCTRARVNLILIAHEDLPEKDHKTNTIVHQTLNLGSSLAFEIPVQFSEVWHISDVGGRRSILLRPEGFLKPIKTRMFTTVKTRKFTWNYDPITEKGGRIDDWYETWKKNNFNKIEPPIQ